MGEAKRRRAAAAAVPNVALSKQVTLPQRVLDSAAKSFEGFWKLAEMIRQNPHLLQGTTGPWHSWCYLPVNAVTGIVAHLLRGQMSPGEVERNLISQTRLLTAVSAWRMTKGVYLFDPTTVKEMAESEVDDDFPDELFFHLPDWCPYVATPGLQIKEGLFIHGFFAYIDDRAHGNRQRFPPELNFEILIDPALSSVEELRVAGLFSPEVRTEAFAELEQGRIAESTLSTRLAELAKTKEYIHMHMNIPLGQGRFTKAFQEQTRELVELQPAGALAEAMSTGSEADIKWVTHFFGQLQARLASLLLYLVSEAPDITPQGERADARNRVVSNEKRGIRTFQAPRVNAWEVGFRIGAEIRAFEERTGNSGEATGTGTGKRPHVRKAHWHSFWTGRRDHPEERKRRVKWLPPIPVKVGDSSDLVPTVHKVVQ